MKTSKRQYLGAFTLIELLVVIAIIAILAGMLMPSLSKAKASALGMQSLNNLRNINLGAIMYADENAGFYPPRAAGSTVTNAAPGNPGYNPRWPGRLFSSYRNLKLLRCPSDTPGDPATYPSMDPADNAPRTYIMNGWNDYFKQQAGPAFTMDYINEKSMPVNALKNPADVVLFGEKKMASHHFFMDLEEGKGNDYEELNQNHHGTGSSYTFADGHAKIIRQWQTVGPTYNLWAVTEAGRTNYAFKF